MCIGNLRMIALAREIVTVSLNTPITFGSVRLTVQGARSPLMMHKQVLAGLQASTTDIVYLCESDVLYHPSHFDYTPPRGVFVYNTNVWKVRYPDGHAVWTDSLQQVSGVCAYRETLLDFYAQRVAQIEQGAFNRHYEPGVRQSVGSRIVANRLSDYPNICIRHDANLTKSKWSPADYRNERYAKGWRESDYVPGWGYTRELFAQGETQ